MHGEVLTLSMDKEAMTNFVSDSPLKDIAPVDGEFSKDFVDEAFSTCLAKVNSSPDSSFRLRLVQKQDLETVERLVQGLADYVKESDEVKMTANDYLKDGFVLDNPLWYCLLVDKVGEDGSRYTCGYAFFFVGYVLGQGRFVYLEDLYLEVDYRGGGGGKTTMKALAGLCRAMQCSHLYWQALDWNTSGLNFYNKIGAKIHEGEKTSRYAGEALKTFAAKGSI
jgi:GNAT superfamily N-acetyltransferase